MKHKIKAYEEALKVSKKYANIFYNDGVSLEDESIESALKTLEVCERFGIEPQYLNFSGYIQVKNSYDNWTGIMFFPETLKHPIGCSDDGRQPKNEWLYVIRFTCGAYVFGDSYPKNTFNAMFEELKSFGAAYSDTVNHSLYFKEDVAKEVHDNFWPIFSKYKALVQEEVKQNRKAALMKELQDLEE